MTCVREWSATAHEQVAAHGTTRGATYAFEVDGQPPLEFVGAKLQQLHTLLERYVGVMMLV